MSDTPPPFIGTAEVTQILPFAHSPWSLCVWGEHCICYIQCSFRGFTLYANQYDKQEEPLCDKTWHVKCISQVDSRQRCDSWFFYDFRLISKWILISLTCQFLKEWEVEAPKYFCETWVHTQMYCFICKGCVKCKLTFVCWWW